MREQIINQLVTMLNNNIGNRLTSEMGTGIATSLNHFILQIEASKLATNGAVDAGVANGGDD